MPLAVMCHSLDITVYKPFTFLGGDVKKMARVLQRSQANLQDAGRHRCSSTAAAGSKYVVFCVIIEELL